MRPLAFLASRLIGSPTLLHRAADSLADSRFSCSSLLNHGIELGDQIINIDLHKLLLLDCKNAIGELLTVFRPFAVLHVIRYSSERPLTCDFVTD